MNLRLTEYNIRSMTYESTFNRV